jgi:hypothetical protein
MKFLYGQFINEEVSATPNLSTYKKLFLEMIVLAVAAGSTTTTIGDSRPSSGDESVNLSIALGVLSAFFAIMFIVLTILAIKKWRRLENQQIKNDNKASASTMKLKTSSKDNVNDPPVRPATLSVPLQKSSHRGKPH